MIENQRSGLVWRLMRRTRPIVRGLVRAGFTGGWLEGRGPGRARREPPSPRALGALLAAARLRARGARADAARPLLGPRARRGGRAGAPPRVPRAAPRRHRRGPADPLDRGAREAPDGVRRRALPDVAQIGNTWLPEFATLDALEDLGRARRALAPSVTKEDYFPGIWETNVVDGVLCGVPWYVDTRVLFYRKDLLDGRGRRPGRRGRWERVARRDGG